MRALGASLAPDPELIKLHRPHAHATGRFLGSFIQFKYQIPPSDMTWYRWDAKYDNHGFRNLSDLKSADIAVIGDSFVEGFTLPDAQLVTSELASLQGEEVANLGHSDYGPKEELVVLRRYGLPLRPRTVVWMFFEGNDLTDVMRYDTVMNDPPSPWRTFVERSFTKNALQGAERFLFPPAKRPGVQRLGIMRTPGGEFRVYFEPHLPESTLLQPNFLGAIQETANTVAAAQELCASHGIRLVFVFIPEKFRVFRSSCAFPAGSECSTWAVNDVPERLQKAVGAASPTTEYLDLTSALIDGVKRGELPYYRDDAHWTEAGHRIAAEAIHDYLISTQNQSLAAKSNEGADRGR